MQRKDYIFWATLPPIVDDLGLLEQATGLAEPLLDLRYGQASYKRFILKKAVQHGLAGLTVFVDCRDKTLTDFLLSLFITKLYNLRCKQCP